MSTETTPRFQSDGWFTVRGRRVAAVACDRERHDFADLLGSTVQIDGRFYRCLGVERRAHAAPWRQGEPIGLMIEEPPR
jgi:hypothetical protein